MMDCPFCGAESYITRTHDATRTRRCLECGREFRTVEVYEHKMEGVKFTRHLLGILNGNGGET